jgi:hypothetical protein
MLLFPLSLAVGIALGRLRGGCFRCLATLRLRLPGLVGVAVMLQVGIGAAGAATDWRFLALGTSYGLMGVWLAVNLGDGPGWRRVGFACVAVGYALNLVSIVPNGSMPVSVAALRRVGGSQGAFHQGPNLDKHVAAGSDAVWRWTGDVVAVPALRAVISVGDMAMLVGVVIVLSEGMVSAGPSFPEGAPAEGNATGQAVV